VVLTAGQWQHRVPVNEGNIADLFARQALLDNDPVPSTTEGLAGEHIFRRHHSLIHGRRDRHPFTRGQAIGLNHDRGSHFPDIGLGFLQGIETGVGRCRDPMARQELLGEGLGAL